MRFSIDPERVLLYGRESETAFEAARQAQAAANGARQELSALEARIAGRFRMTGKNTPVTDDELAEIAKLKDKIARLSDENKRVSEISQVRSAAAHSCIEYAEIRRRSGGREFGSRFVDRQKVDWSKLGAGAGDAGPGQVDRALDDGWSQSSGR